MCRAVPQRIFGQWDDPVTHCYHRKSIAPAKMMWSLPSEPAAALTESVSSDAAVRYFAFVPKKSLAPQKRRSIGLLRCSHGWYPPPGASPIPESLQQRGDRFRTSAGSDRTGVLEAHHRVLNGAEGFDAGRVEQDRTGRRVVGGSSARRGIIVTTLNACSQHAVNQASRSCHRAWTGRRGAARTKVHQRSSVGLVVGPVSNFCGVDG